MTHGDRLVTRGAGLHDAAHVVVAGFRTAALVGEVDFHSRDPVAEPAQSPLNNGLDLAGQFRAALDVIVGVDLDLHD